MKLGREAVDSISGTFTKVTREALTNMLLWVVSYTNSYNAYMQACKKLENPI
jgi:hypothetical protein